VGDSVNNTTAAATTNKVSMVVDSVIDLEAYVWSIAFTCGFQSKYLYRAEPLVLAIGLNNGRIKIWSVVNNRLLYDLLDHREVVRQVCFDPNESLLLLSASHDKTFKVWDMRDNGNLVHTYKASSWVMCCAWSADSKHVACGGRFNKIMMWNTRDWSVKHQMNAHRNAISDLHFSPDGVFLASASWDTTVWLFDVTTGSRLSVFCHMVPPPNLIMAFSDNGHFVHSVSFSHDGIHFATVCNDGYLRIWNMFDNTRCVRKTDVGLSPYCTHSVDGSAVAACSKEGIVNLFSVAYGEVPTLAHWARLMVRRAYSPEQVARLTIPREVFDYVMFKEHFANGA
jgi:WD repeat/SOCS box-containing protein 1